MSVNNFVSLDGIIIKEPVFSVMNRRYEAVMVTKKRKRNRDTGLQENVSEYHKIIAIKDKADLMNELTKQGTKIHIHGENVTDDAGNIRYVQVDTFDVKS